MPTLQPTLMQRLRKYLIAGLLVWVPLAITLWVLNLTIGTLDKLGDLMPNALRIDYWLLQLLAASEPQLAGYQRIPGFGMLLTVMVLLFTGLLATNFFGRRLFRVWEALLRRIPIVSSIYSSVKQVSDTLFSDSGNAFREAVLVQFPHQGTWAVGFVTGTPSGEVSQLLVSEAAGEELISVFVPTTPNPTSGFMFMLPRSAVRPLAMSVDQALKYVISMGVVAPPATPANSVSVVPPAAAHDQQSS